MATRDPAMGRFWAMQLVRLMGMALAFSGLVIVAGQVSGVPTWVGVIVVLIGMVDILFIPKLMARRWRSAD